MKRLISKKQIQKAYIKDIYNNEDDFEIEKEDKLDHIPSEIFEILGSVIAFIEDKDKIEGEKNENK